MLKKDKQLVIIISFLTFIISFLLIYNIIILYINKDGDKNNIIYSTNTQNNIDYYAHLKPNPYIEQNVLNKDYSYISSLIDFIRLDFYYENSFTKKTDLNYTYKIIGTIIGNSNEEASKQLINKEYILLPETDILKTSKNISINQDLDLKLNDYNMIADSFLNELGIKPDLSLEVKLLININSTINEEIINLSHHLTVNIPLAVKIFDITTNANFSEQETIYLEPPPEKSILFVRLILLITAELVIITIAYILIKKIFEKYHSKYSLIKNKILKNFDDQIVEVKTFVKYTKWETVDIKSFNELLNLANEAFEPIYFWERRNNYHKEAWFCILRDRVLYRYILTKEQNNEEK